MVSLWDMIVKSVWLGMLSVWVVIKGKYRTVLYYDDG